MSEPVFMFDNDAAMQEASAAARRSFKYFWRELSWEARRIVPGLDMSMVKLPFTDGPRTDGQAEYEHMWIGEVDFDGETISGKLLNAPNWLTSVRKEDAVRVPFSRLSDWMMTMGGRAYGGFTVNAIRARMGGRERKEHDQAWGLDFGDPGEVRLELAPAKPEGGFLAGLFGGRPKNTMPPEGFKDHPMCINVLGTCEAQLKADSSIVHTVDDAGWTLLHREALAGNFGVVKLFVSHGADVKARTRSGRTASDLARGIGWPEIADYLDAKAKA
jgi:uncharacterized protein YegJ (DUF2314 family)